MSLFLTLTSGTPGSLITAQWARFSRQYCLGTTFHRDLGELSKVSKEVEKTVFHDGGVVDTSVSVLKLLAVLQIICALYSAYRYRKNYLKYDHYDNYVMEQPEVSNVNDQRRRVGAESVLPLSFWEKQRYIPRMSVACSLSERGACCLGCCRVMCVLLLVNSVLLADYLLYKTVSSVESYARVVDEAIFQKTFYSVELVGSGFVKELYQQMIDVLLPKSRLEEYVSTNACYPQLSKPDYSQYAFMFTMEVVVILSVLVTPYFLRLRSAICHSFHPDRRQKRTLWLINQILIKRSRSIIPFEGRSVKGSGGKRRKLSCWAYCLETTPLLARILKCITGKRLFISPVENLLKISQFSQ
ncbi:DC-STAMP domain-containing protein 2-like [Convolutriloba macropyga]|uniref:DC-STAMP domain-containing protein 2-like n=1 Tax=Convolutriloba macropyga TaxID=536237 RepID=UPI003F524FD0